MSKYLLLKTGNDIFVNDRQDKSKTDLQSNELIAFAKCLHASLKQNVPITKHKPTVLLGCTADTMLSNNVSDYGMLLHDMHNIFSIDAYSNELTDFSKEDSLIVFCGLWNDIDKTESLAYKAKSIIETFPGEVYYVYNDLRLTLHESIDASKINLVTQAMSLEPSLCFKFKSVQYLELHQLPYYYVQRPISDFKTFDLSVSTMKFADLDSKRQQKFTELLTNDNVRKLFIGSYDFDISSSNYMTTGTVKHSKVARYLKLAYSSYIVSEELYDANSLVPNRVYEAILSNSGLIIDRQAYNTLCIVEPNLAKYAEVVDSHKEITQELALSAYRKVKDLHMTNILETRKEFFAKKLANYFSGCMY